MTYEITKMKFVNTAAAVSKRWQRIVNDSMLLAGREPNIATATHFSQGEVLFKAPTNGLTNAGPGASHRLPLFILMPHFCNANTLHS